MKLRVTGNQGSGNNNQTLNYLKQLSGYILSS